jgi:hypothetical protein
MRNAEGGAFAGWVGRARSIASPAFQVRVNEGAQVGFCPAVMRDRTGTYVMTAEESLEIIHEAGGKW